MAKRKNKRPSARLLPAEVDDSCAVCGKRLQVRGQVWKSMKSRQGRAITAPVCEPHGDDVLSQCQITANRIPDQVAGAIYRRQKGDLMAIVNRRPVA